MFALGDSSKGYKGGGSSSVSRTRVTCSPCAHGCLWPLMAVSCVSVVASSTGDVMYVPFSCSVWILISGMGLSGGMERGSEYWYEISF